MSKKKKRAWLTYAAFIAGTEAVGGLAGLLTREGSRLYNTFVTKPPLSPPPMVFPIAWGILYALMGAGAAMVYLAPPSPERSVSLLLFFLQLLFNFLWSLIFFNAQSYGFAFFWLLALWVLILAMTLAFRKINKTAALLQIPYLLWVAFAAYLNLGVWVLNR